jgi:hypothetical protein
MDVVGAVAVDERGLIVQIDYAPGATISRVNKGLRRRREKSLFGFGIDPASGRWTGGITDDDDEPSQPDGPIVQRIVPIVEDNKNAALLRLAAKFQSASAMPTLQHAFTRGLETVFQLEEGETLTEPVPTRDSRNAILVFEATEGGAGVLSRLVAEPKRLAEVAKSALNVMHYQNVNEAVASGDLGKLTDDLEARCVKGCYRCLLSYYNQPDHEFIDRTDKEALETLVRIASGEVRPAKAIQPGPEDWCQRMADWRLPEPDSTPLQVGQQTFPLVWRDHLAVATTSTLTEKERADVEALGFSVVAINSAIEPPADLVALLGGRQ